MTNIDADVAPGANASYTGGAGENLLDGTGQFSSGQSFRVNVLVEVDPNAPGSNVQFGRLINQALVTSNDVAAPGVMISDLSDDRF